MSSQEARLSIQIQVHALRLEKGTGNGETAGQAANPSNFPRCQESLYEAIPATFYFHVSNRALSPLFTTLGWSS